MTRDEKSPVGGDDGVTDLLASAVNDKLPKSDGAVVDVVEVPKIEVCDVVVAAGEVKVAVT